jgi:mannose-6-phosphate isomerase-like protein (cupin superfamily)
MHGRARVMLGDTFDEVQAGDVVYIPSWERHQFTTIGDEPFSFLCIIPPKPVK